MAGAGFSVVELLFVLAAIATLAGVGTPLTTNALDELRVGMAGADYTFTTCVDGTSLSVDGGMWYRGALLFDERRDWTREVGTLAG
jgi:hypothetical protein